MKEEDIEKAANDYANENMRYPGEISYESDIEEMMKSFADAFKAGAYWHINIVRRAYIEDLLPNTED